MIVNAGGVKCGEGNFIIIGGPCAVESEEQIMTIAKAVKDCGGDMLRGGAFKPRTSPYDFQGIKDDGIKYLVEAKKATGLPIVTEITGVEYLDLYDEVDVVQVGARNMQNFELLMELGKTKKTVLLKRGMANTLRELLMSAEYILAGGNDNVILCERGIRTFDEETRNTLDLASVPALRKMTDLPIIVDPSHGTGHADLVAPMAAAAAACGADGIMIEVHDEPAKALSDGEQAVTPDVFADIVAQVRRVRAAL